MTTSLSGNRKFGVRPRVPRARGDDPNAPNVVATIARFNEALSQPFVGITTNGSVVPGLYSLQETGVSTAPIKEAAEALIATLSDAQKATALFPIDAPEWRKWANFPSFAIRHGLLLDDLSHLEREAVMDLVRASLSAHGFELTRNVMKLNEVLGQLNGDTAILSEWLYWLTLFGTPSDENGDEPWGWQIDGHHLIVNCFILKDQMVLTPVFMGAEPNYADEGPYAGTVAFVEEESRGLELMQALSPAQQEQATLYRSMLAKDLPEELAGRGDGRHRGGALRDNFVLPYEGVGVDGFSDGQRDLLLKLIETYVGRMPTGHAQIKLDEVKRHLDETYFAWIGGFGADSVFYYKVHSPVIWIEFDHHAGIFLDNEEPERYHVHTIVRTPNGNDYGKDLLRQHYEKYHR